MTREELIDFFELHGWGVKLERYDCLYMSSTNTLREDNTGVKYEARIKERMFSIHENRTGTKIFRARIGKKLNAKIIPGHGVFIHHDDIYFKLL